MSANIEMAFSPILEERRKKSPFSNRMVCGICKQQFWMTCKFIDHMTTHNHFLLSCNICNKDFYDQEKLDKHYITHKEVVNTYDCNQCTKKFLQKHELEQHLQQLHLNPVLLKGSKVRKKTVHFNYTLESRQSSIDDSSDDDSFEDYRPSKTKTRSGRTVKVKKLFDYEPEIKRRRKNTDKVCLEMSAGKLNAVQENLIATTSSSSDSGILSDKTVLKELRVMSEKIPDHIYKMYVSKGNVCTYDISKNQKSHNNNNVSNDSETISINNKVMENNKESNMSSKNTSAIINFNTSELSMSLNRKKVIDYNVNIFTKTTRPQSSGILNSNHCDSVPVLSKEPKNDAKISGTKADISKTSNLTCRRNLSDTATASKLQLPTNPDQSHDSQANNVKMVTEKPFTTSSPPKQVITSCLNTSPRVDKQFLYVGPKQDLKKIKTIIDEIKIMENVNNLECKLITGDNNSKLSKNTCNKTLENIENLAEDNSDVNTGTSPLSPTSKNVCNKSDSTDMTPTGQLVKSVITELESSEGVLEKTIVKDFILVKVTPEFMKQMQKKTIFSQQMKLKNSESFNNIVKSEPCSTDTILPMSSGLNKDINTASDGNKMIEKIIQTEQNQISHKVSSVTTVSNIVDLTVKTSDGIGQNLKSSEIAVAPKVKSIYTTSQTEKVPVQNVELNSSSNGKFTLSSSKSEKIGYSSQKKKLIECYKAKMKEKEHKKREKYEFKKKMRYMLKSLCIDNPVSTAKKSRLPNSIISNRSTIEASVAKGMDSDIDTQLMKILVENATLAYKSIKKLITASVVTNENFSCYSTNSLQLADFGSDKLLNQHQVLKAKEHKLTEKKAVQKAYEISLKFQKKLSEEECLSMLDELDILVTSFNISKKCPFLFPIIRFCKLYLDSYKVKEQAMSLHTKITKASA